MVTPSKNEILLHDQDAWLYFSRPYQIIAAETIEEVIPALSNIEQIVEENQWYAAGFLSYEAAAAFDSAMHTKPISGFPYLWFGLYPRPQTVKLNKATQTKQVLDWQPTIDRASYNAAIEQIHEYIAQGKTYQVNYTMRLQADFDIDPWQFFLHLAQGQNNHAAYIDTGRHVICSASPELFFALEEQQITCRPMKGTIRRGRTTMDDHQQSEWLKQSEKNRAENVMIVDMIRNDLGRIAATGSVHVPELFCTERYPTLWQMTSTVTAEVHTSLTGVFRALFPCASITGAPKVRTMQIIEELETTPRKIYTGAIGYLSPHGRAKFNVAIRTLLVDRENQKAEYGAGGGIVWDSTSTDEYAEALLKARLLTESQPDFSLLETMLWTPEDGFYLRERHMARLSDSADYFAFPCPHNAIEAKLDEISASFHSPQRVRLLLNREGNVDVESTPIPLASKPLCARLAKKHVDTNNIFLFHKTTQRRVYKQASANAPDCEDVLLWNERGELTEFTIGNLVAELDGQLVTPPIACGVLAGTFRGYLLDTGQILEQVIPTERVQDCTKIFRINSVRMWETVRLQGL